jgi:hypothetical protein
MEELQTFLDDGSRSVAVKVFKDFINVCVDINIMYIAMSI